MLGLCVAGALAGYLMQREMLNARLDQAKAIGDMGLSMAVGLGVSRVYALADACRDAITTPTSTSA